CENMVARDAPLSELDNDATDFLDRPADQERRLGCRRGGVFLSAGSALARWRMTAIMAKASMTRETWRCQPCQERVSLWSRPNSFLAVSKLSSIAQRCPSIVTSISMPVPAGHQVEKKAKVPRDNQGEKRQACRDTIGLRAAGRREQRWWACPIPTAPGADMTDDDVRA